MQCNDILIVRAEITSRLSGIQNQSPYDVCNAFVDPERLDHDLTPQRNSPHRANVGILRNISGRIPQIASQTITSSMMDIPLMPHFAASSKSQPCWIVHPVKWCVLLLELTYRMWLGAGSWVNYALPLCVGQVDKCGISAVTSSESGLSGFSPLQITA